ncbi:MAG TPA: DASS family sodium-coupled anion symporter [Planctomycetota bacterium]|nr:DASS family sodium-coupled anion symporter [Planctomycetota bacterium]
MQEGEAAERQADLKKSRWRAGIVLFAAGAAVLPLLLATDPVQGRVLAICAGTLILWLAEPIPLYATTLVLWTAIVTLLAPLGKEFSPASVLRWAADPILALFFGGFVLGVAGEKYGIDKFIASRMVLFARGSRMLLFANVMLGTAVLSMWMSNIAAVVMILAALMPILKTMPPGDAYRSALLLGVAFAANLGGMATPIGTGPNGIAIGAISHVRQITFLHWMSFALPLTLGMLLAAFLYLALRYRVGGRLELENIETPSLDTSGKTVVALFSLAVLGWLTEPIHNIPAAILSTGVSALLFGIGLLDKDDLGRIDWGTLLLIAGGLTFGQLLQTSRLAEQTAAALNLAALDPTLVLLIFVVAAAFLAAVASNTAAAILFIQLGTAAVPAEWFTVATVIIALGTSMGMPFVISTPPNAMVYGKGGLRSTELLVPGMLLMVLGCAILVFTGPPVLRWFGI